MGHHEGRELIARAIIIQDTQVLVNHTPRGKKGVGYFALPGGHVDPGESCLVALRRELQEELEVEITVHGLAFVSESIYAGRKEPRHELVLYFWAILKTPLPDRDGRIFSPEHNKNFGWLPLAALPESNLLPHAIKQFLLNTCLKAAAPESPLYVFEDTTRA